MSKPRQQHLGGLPGTVLGEPNKGRFAPFQDTIADNGDTPTSLTATVSGDADLMPA
jgi:hypothetical protein